MMVDKKEKLYFIHYEVIFYLFLMGVLTSAALTSVAWYFYFNKVLGGC